MYLLNITDVMYSFFSGLLSIINSVTSYIVNIFAFISSVGITISTMAITFFATMPNFISSGLLSIFSLGIIILILKIIRI